MKLDPLSVTRLEKAARDNGFDLPQNTTDDFLGFASSHCPIKIWLGKTKNGLFSVALSDQDVCKNLKTLFVPSDDPKPEGSISITTVPDLISLYEILKRAYHLSRALPNEPLKEFKKKVQGMPHSTEIERTVIQRVGQNIFRERLLEYWDGKCTVTGLKLPELLRASHIKPWSACSSDDERLDVFNGLLLAPNLDLSFDKGFITFDNSGVIKFSSLLDETSKLSLGLNSQMKISGLEDNHRNYLNWHREHIFKK